MKMSYFQDRVEVASVRVNDVTVPFPSFVIALPNPVSNQDTCLLRPR